MDPKRWKIDRTRKNGELNGETLGTKLQNLEID